MIFQKKKKKSDLFDLNQIFYIIILCYAIK